MVGTSAAMCSLEKHNFKLFINHFPKQTSEWQITRLKILFAIAIGQSLLFSPELLIAMNWREWIKKKKQSQLCLVPTHLIVICHCTTCTQHHPTPNTRHHLTPQKGKSQSTPITCIVSFMSSSINSYDQQPRRFFFWGGGC